jgi:hypothetical protein
MCHVIFSSQSEIKNKADDTFLQLMTGKESAFEIISLSICCCFFGTDNKFFRDKYQICATSRRRKKLRLIYRLDAGLPHSPLAAI